MSQKRRSLVRYNLRCIVGQACAEEVCNLDVVTFGPSARFSGRYLLSERHRSNTDVSMVSLIV